MKNTHFETDLTDAAWELIRTLSFWGIEFIPHGV
jgi:hypothetical protein